MRPSILRRIACDLAASATHPGWWNRRVRNCRAAAAEQLRRVRLAVFDLDGTLTPSRSSWSRVTAHFPGNEWRAWRAYWRYQLGALSYGELCRTIVGLWQPPPRRAFFDRLCRETTLSPSARELCEHLRRRGIELAIVSTGIDLFAEHVGGALGIDRTVANALAFDPGGVLLPEVEVRVTPPGKPAWVRRLGAELGIAPEQVLFIGDARDDRPAVEGAGVGIFLDNANPAKGSACLLVDSLAELLSCWESAG